MGYVRPRPDYQVGVHKAMHDDYDGAKKGERKGCETGTCMFFFQILYNPTIQMNLWCVTQT